MLDLIQDFNANVLWNYKGGVELDYNAQDTIKSFLINNKENKDQKLNNIKMNSPTKNAKKIKSFEPKKFLKKGQGKAAWSCTARNLGLKVSNNEFKNLEITNRNKINSDITRSDLNITQLKNTELRDPNPDGCLENSVSETPGDSTELREFELLEKAVNDVSVYENNQNFDNVLIEKTESKLQIKDVSLESIEVTKNPETESRQCIELANSNNNAFETNSDYFHSEHYHNYNSHGSVGISRKIARFKPKIQVGTENFIPKCLSYSSLGNMKASPPVRQLTELPINLPNVESKEPCTQVDIPPIQPSNIEKPVFDNDELPLPPVFSDTNSAKGSALVLTENLKSWIDRLETEIKTFHSKNAKLEKSRMELEKSISEFEMEKKKLYQNFNLEKSNFEEYKNSELQKFKKERKVLDEYSKSIKNCPTKQEREQIESLKIDITCLKQEFELKESRSLNQINNARSRITALEIEKDNLLRQVTSLESDLLRTRSAMNKFENSVSCDAIGDVRQKTFDSVNNQVNNLVSKTSIQAPYTSHKSRSVSRLSHEIQQRPTTSARSNSNNRDAVKTRIECHNPPISDQISTEFDPSSHHNPATYSTTSHFFIDPKSELSTRTSPVPAHHFDVNGKTNGLVGLEGLKFSATDELVVPDRLYSAKSYLAKYDSNINVPKFSNSLFQWPEPNKFPRDEIVNKIHNVDGSTEIHYRNGLIVINFSNGSVKELYPDRQTSIVTLFNGDLKRNFADGKVIYHYAADGSVQTTYPNGVEEMRYPNGKVEVLTTEAVNTTKKIVFTGPDLPVVVPPTSSSVCTTSDGEKIKEVRRPNGEIELHCTLFKRRIYPDGNVKTVYANGTHETRYASGRIRIKDSLGNLIVDTYQEPNTRF